MSVQDGPEETRRLILDVLGRRTGAATTARNMAMWFGRPLDEVKAELARLRDEGLAEPLPTCRGRARIWVSPDSREP